jgi:hypothetical protein
MQKKIGMQKKYISECKKNIGIQKNISECKKKIYIGIQKRLIVVF